MNRSNVFNLAATLALASMPWQAARATTDFGADTGNGASYTCHLEKGVFYDASGATPTYRAAGSCVIDGELAGRWQSQGTFDPSSGATVESITLVPTRGPNGSVNTFPQGQIRASMTCPRDPWLAGASCTNVTVFSSDSTVQTVASGLYGYPFPRSSNLSDGARNALNQAYQAAHTVAHIGPVPAPARTAPPAATTALALNDPATSAAAARPSHRSITSTLSPQAREALVAAATQGQRPNAVRPASPPPAASQPQAAVQVTAPAPAPAPAHTAAAARQSVGTVAHQAPPTSQQAAAATPQGGETANLERAVREAVIPAALLHMDEGAIIIVGGVQAHVGEVKRRILQLDDRTVVNFAGRRVRAAVLKQELQHTGTAMGASGRNRANWAALPGQAGGVNASPTAQNTMPVQGQPASIFKPPESSLSR